MECNVTNWNEVVGYGLIGFFALLAIIVAIIVAITEARA